MEGRGSGGGKIYQYNLTTPHDLTSGSYSNNSWNPGNVTPDSSIDTLWVRPNGASMYVATANILYQYDLTTPWDLSATINYASKSFDGAGAPSGTTGWNGIWMSDDGAVLLRAGDGTTDDQKERYINMRCLLLGISVRVAMLQKQAYRRGWCRWGHKPVRHCPQQQWNGSLCSDI